MLYFIAVYMLVIILIKCVWQFPIFDVLNFTGYMMSWMTFKYFCQLVILGVYKYF